MSERSVVVGVDLGSTTTKSVVLDADARVLGRGITNSRSNYEVASRVAREEAFVQARLGLVRETLELGPGLRETAGGLLSRLERAYRRAHYAEQLERLGDELRRAAAGRRHRSYRRELTDVVGRISAEMAAGAEAHFGPLSVRKSDFFRDLASAEFVRLAEGAADPQGISFELLMSLFDQAILPVENSTGERPLERLLADACRTVFDGGPGGGDGSSELRRSVQGALETRFEEDAVVGTGYGRQRLPFAKDAIRSEILCHGLGAHAMFPATRTVLDIGGQDTKAIQVDERGIVTGFQMNDRCAAGCGRYLGYIADEMNLGLHELGPLAEQSTCHVKINSTCTVFAGAELRERLSLGQKREDILAGLHRAIVLRAMSLLARSGGVSDEFTFTGGVARNPAAVAALEQLVRENYGRRTLNISPESIYTGALGAALFARRGLRRAA